MRTQICQNPLAPFLNFLSVSNSAAGFTLHLPLFILQPKNILFTTIANRFSTSSSPSHYSWYGGGRKMNYRWILLLLLFKSMQSSEGENWNESSEEVMIRDGYLQWVKKMGLLKHSVFMATKNKVTPTKTVTVSKTNTIGCFVSVQEAIDSLPFISLQRVIIKIHGGVYREKVEIPPTKAYITLVGAGADKTVIEWGDSADHIRKDGKPLGTFGSATVAVNSPYFVAKNITFKNTAPLPPSGASGKQGVALRISGDTAAFVGCKFYGGQDTLYDHEGRHYFRDCYIEGSVDFIFGNGLSLYEGCHLHAISDAYGALTAQSRGSILEETGFSFLRCKVTGSGALYLGRAWGTFSRVVFAYTFMDKIIMPRGWYNWGDPRRQMTVFYGQYQCYGPGSNFSGRVSWSKELTSQEAQPFLSLSFIDGSEWLHY